MNRVWIAAALAFLGWVVLAWFMAVPSPAVHLLLALAATLVVYGVGRRA